MVQKALKAVHHILHNSVTYRGIVSSNFTSGIEQYNLQGGGAHDPSNVITTKNDQGYNFTSTDLKILLDVCGLAPVAITGVTTDTFKFYMRELADGGVFTGSTTDLIGTINLATMYLRNISATQFGGPAIATYDVVPKYDGTNSPIALTQGTAPTLTRDAVAWGMGTLKINSVDIPIQSINFDMGLQMEKRGSAGLIYNTECFTVSRNPVIRFGILNALQLLPAGLSPLIGANAPGTVLFTFRKFAMGGGFVANATEEHISFSIANAVISCQGTGGSGNGLAELELVVTPVYDASTAIIVMDTTAAIT